MVDSIPPKPDEKLTMSKSILFTLSKNTTWFMENMATDMDGDKEGGGGGRTCHDLNVCPTSPRSRTTTSTPHCFKRAAVPSPAGPEPITITEASRGMVVAAGAGADELRVSGSIAGIVGVPASAAVSS